MISTSYFNILTIFLNGRRLKHSQRFHSHNTTLSTKKLSDSFGTYVPSDASCSEMNTWWWTRAIYTLRIRECKSLQLTFAYCSTKYCVYFWSTVCYDRLADEPVLPPPLPTTPPQNWIQLIPILEQTAANNHQSSPFRLCWLLIVEYSTIRWHCHCSIWQFSVRRSVLFL